MASQLDGARNLVVRDFLAKVTQWGSTQHDISALALVGSYARKTATADSDVDLIILATDWRKYLTDDKWIELFGEVEGKQVENYGNVTSFRVWYKDGFEVEYGFADET